MLKEICTQLRLNANIAILLVEFEAQKGISSPREYLSFISFGSSG